jgi:hypothetical protein
MQKPLGSLGSEINKHSLLLQLLIAEGCVLPRTSSVYKLATHYMWVQWVTINIELLTYVIQLLYNNELHVITRKPLIYN